MATLPTAADVLGKVSPTSLAPVKIDRSVFPDYSAAFDLGTELFATGLALQEKDNETEAQDLVNQLNTSRRELFDGTSDEQPGFASLKGKHAKDERERVEAAFEKKRKELLGSASNDAVRRKVSPLFARQSETFLGRVAGHVRTQTDVYTQEVNEATTIELRQNAIENGGARASIGVVWRHAYRTAFNKTGVADNARSAAETAVSNAHSGVINELTINDPVAAREYFEANKAEIDRGEWKKLMPAIKDNEQKIVADADRRDLEYQFDLTTAEGKRRANAALDAKYEGRPDQLTASKTALEASIKRAEDDHKEIRAEIEQRVRTKVLQDPNALLTPEELEVVQTEKGLNDWVRKVQKAGGRPVVPDGVSFANMADYQTEYEKWVANPDLTPDPRTFFRDWETKLNTTHYEEARKKLEALRAAHRGEKVKASETTIQTSASRIKNALITAGVYDLSKTAAKQSEETKTAVARFTREVEIILQAEADNLKRALTPAEAQKIIDTEASRLVWVDSKWGGQDPRYPVLGLTPEIIDDDDVYVPMDNLSAREIKDTRDVLSRTGIPVNDDNVGELAAAARRGIVEVQIWLNQNAPANRR